MPGTPHDVGTRAYTLPRLCRRCSRLQTRAEFLGKVCGAAWGQVPDKALAGRRGTPEAAQRWLPTVHRSAFITTTQVLSTVRCLALYRATNYDFP